MKTNVLFRTVSAFKPQVLRPTKDSRSAPCAPAGPADLEEDQAIPAWRLALAPEKGRYLKH